MKEIHEFKEIHKYYHDGVKVTARIISHFWPMYDIIVIELASATQLHFQVLCCSDMSNRSILSKCHL